RWAARSGARPARAVPAVAPGRSAGGDPGTRGPRSVAPAGAGRVDARAGALDRVRLRRAGYARRAAGRAGRSAAQPRPGSLACRGIAARDGPGAQLIRGTAGVVRMPPGATLGHLPAVLREQGTPL